MDRLVGPLQSWLAGRAEFAGRTVSAVVPFSGGASNITCRVDLEGAGPRHVVLRVERGEGIFVPYDVLREGRVLTALDGAPFPVPKVLASEPDARALGAPFLILEYIDGRHMGEPDAEADFGAFVGAVAEIHATDWRARGLEFLGVAPNARAAVEAEIDAVVARMERFGCADSPALHRAEAILRRFIPDDGELSLCQGDINVFNYLFKGGRLVGVVDWEQARISDLRGDLGQLVALSHLKGAAFVPPREVGFIQAYEAVSGRRIERLEYFRAFWLFQLRVIYDGWIAYNDTLPWYSKAEVDSLMARALAEIA